MMTRKNPEYNNTYKWLQPKHKLSHSPLNLQAYDWLIHFYKRDWKGFHKQNVSRNKNFTDHDILEQPLLGCVHLDIPSMLPTKTLAT